jgi:hypothetical protein
MLRMIRTDGSMVGKDMNIAWADHILQDCVAVPSDLFAWPGFEVRYWLIPLR